MGAHTFDPDLCLTKFLKYMTDKDYTIYVNLKPGSMHD